MTTYHELLRLKSVPCSCCGQPTHPNCSLVTTGDGDVVEWIQCWDCEQVCDTLRGRLPGESCGNGAACREG